MNDSDPSREFFRRLMEGYDRVKAATFKVGSQVVLIRPLLYSSVTIPVGAVGVITDIAPAESVMMSKGRPFEVEFDLSEYSIPLDKDFKKMLIESGMREGSFSEYYLRVAVYLGPYDIDLEAGH